MNQYFFIHKCVERADNNPVSVYLQCTRVLLYSGVPVHLTTVFLLRTSRMLLSSSKLFLLSSWGPSAMLARALPSSRSIMGSSTSRHSVQTKAQLLKKQPVTGHKLVQLGRKKHSNAEFLLC